ncbi:MAG: hypothetical protein ABJF11_15805 [Reichenbachiella sp.]|uniref:hypothetical protein n=1 Tax=Reichenbachiella sp. TaxID=2184521 RepID=UPI003267B5D9
MRTRIIGIFGILLITTVLIIYIRDAFNFSPLFMGETQKVTAYVIQNNIVPHGRGVTHKIEYQYTFNSRVFQDYYYTNKRLSSLVVGDSIIIKVSIRFPSQNQITGTFSHR